MKTPSGAEAGEGGISGGDSLLDVLLADLAQPMLSTPGRKRTRLWVRQAVAFRLVESVYDSLPAHLLKAEVRRIDGHEPLFSAGHVWYAQSSRAPLIDSR